MKKTQILVLSALVFLLAGCQSSSVKQEGKQGEDPGSKKTVTETQAQTQTQVQVASLAIKPDTTEGGVYTGKSTEGACDFSFSVKVSGTKVTGTGAGPGKDISCAVTLDGTTDAQGRMLGTAEATYTVVAKGVTLNWSLSGPFQGSVSSGVADNLIIDLTGTGNNCPANIPCDNDPDTIKATLAKQES